MQTVRPGQLEPSEQLGIERGLGQRVRLGVASHSEEQKMKSRAYLLMFAR